MSYILPRGFSSCNVLLLTLPLRASPDTSSQTFASDILIVSTLSLPSSPLSWLHAPSFRLHALVLYMLHTHTHKELYVTQTKLRWSWRGAPRAAVVFTTGRKTPRAQHSTKSTATHDEEQQKTTDLFAFFFATPSRSRNAYFEFSSAYQLSSKSAQVEIHCQPSLVSFFCSTSCLEVSERNLPLYPSIIFCCVCICF